jgi:hypothetical protein
MKNKKKNGVRKTVKKLDTQALMCARALNAVDQ